MLSGHKIGTYLLYAVGEIFLVVIGILIAVQIDNWNEERKLIAQQDNYLNRLIADNKQDLRSFEVLLQDTQMAIQSIDDFCHALTDDSSSDSLILHTANQYMTYGSIVPIFNSSRSTFDDLSSTGNLKVISNHSLRDMVVQHYAGMQKVQERMRIDSDWALSLDMPFYYEIDGMKFVPGTAHLFPKQTQAQLANELRKNKLKYINNAAIGYWVDQDATDLLIKLSTQTSELISQIENHLGISNTILPDPLAAGWKGQQVCEILEENDKMRILKCTFPPGVGHERHYHDPHIGFTVAGGRFQIKDTTGIREVDVTTGSSFTNKGIAWHEVLNVGTTTAQFLIIESK